MLSPWVLSWASFVWLWVCRPAQLQSTALATPPRTKGRGPATRLVGHRPTPSRTAPHRIDRLRPPAVPPPMRAVAAAASPPFRTLLLLFSPHLPAPTPRPRSRFAMNPSSSSSSSGSYHSRPAAFASPQPRGGGGRRRGGGGRGGGDGSDRIDALGRLL